MASLKTLQVWLKGKINLQRCLYNVCVSVGLRMGAKLNGSHLGGKIIPIDGIAAGVC